MDNYNPAMNSNGPPPVFPRHDPATPAFWDVRFDADFTPWDQGGVPQCLIEFVNTRAKPLRTLIPGCGSAYEVRFLAERAWPVLAVDFSASAVARAARILGALATHVQEADFFGPALQPGQFDLVYERAFMCALPRTMRADWARRVAELLAPGALLAGFFFFDETPKGPPFGISETALNEMLLPAFECIEMRAPPDSIPVFTGKEQWMVWRRR
jgi:SAM-dependent methyltransferase